MYRLTLLGALCLLLGGCVYYPYGYGYPPPRYGYAPPPVRYGYTPAPPSAYPAPAYPYGGYSPTYPRTLGPAGDTSGATGG
jgi:hypothetical protein